MLSRLRPAEDVLRDALMRMLERLEAADAA